MKASLLLLPIILLLLCPNNCPIDNNYFEAHKSIIHNYVHFVFYFMLSNWLGHFVMYCEGNYIPLHKWALHRISWKYYEHYVNTLQCQFSKYNAFNVMSMNTDAEATINMVNRIEVYCRYDLFMQVMFASLQCNNMLIVNSLTAMRL